jgi:hypothetical protein
MRKAVLFMILIILSEFVFSNGGGEDLYNTNSNTDGKPIVIVITPGPGWHHSFKYKSITINSTPQIVVWAESPDGEYIDTFFITEKFGKQNWRGTPEQIDNETYRIETFPCWISKIISAGMNPPTKDNPFPDEITGATPDSGFTVNSCIKTDLNEICILLEVNHSYDGNDNFPDNEPSDSGQYIPVSGQPSIVYKAIVKLNESSVYLLEPAGHSDPDGLNGSLTEDLSGITTAIQIAARIEVIIE